MNLFHKGTITGRLHLNWIAAALLALLVCVAYAPFLGNSMVFDDYVFFSGGSFAYYAMAPFGLSVRHPPYFTLAFPQVMWGKFPPWDQAELHRVISLFFHWACAYALYCLLRDLLAAMTKPGAPRGVSQPLQLPAAALALGGAAIFAIHPVAVYGAGYLVQRSIVMAALFSLISLIFFVRGMSPARYGHALYAALFYSLAILSKEHGLLLPAAAVLMVPLFAQERGLAIRYSLVYLIACIPAAVWITALSRGVIGHSYEPYIETLLDQIEGIPALDFTGYGAWLISASTQAGLFFQYLYLWLVPDTSMMSIDMRVDFAATWSLGWVILKFSAFAGFGALGFLLLIGRGRVGLIGLGMLYVWIQFVAELSTVRFQEPFVLYRSFLWAPGIILVITVALSFLPRKALVIVFIIAMPFLYFQSYNRLQSFSSNLALWEDAAAKLPTNRIPYGSRVLFGLAREQIYAGQIQEAAQTAQRCVTQYPKDWQCNFSRGAAYVQQGAYVQALEYFERALAAQPNSGMVHTHRGIALERLGRLAEARVAYRRASEIGFLGGDYRLSLLDSPSTSQSRIIFQAPRVHTQ